MDTTKRIYPALPHWVAWMYGLLALVTIPWTIYLAATLPTRHLSPHWDASWVGLDIAIITMLGVNAINSYLESKWLVMSATATSTLLIIDAWFDLTSARGARDVSEAILMALLIELPLAIVTFLVALRLVKREHLATHGATLKH